MSRKEDYWPEVFSGKVGSGKIFYDFESRLVVTERKTYWPGLSAVINEWLQDYGKVSGWRGFTGWKHGKRK